MQLYQTKMFFTSKEDGNLAFHVGDDEKNVINNHKKLAQKFTYNIDKLIHMKQIHSDVVHIVTDEDSFTTPPTCDALVTNKKNTPLMVMVADCSAVLFYDNVAGVIAVAHAGRAGAFKNIVTKVIDVMKYKFGSQTKNIYVKIGANIDVCCYEVGKEIYDEGCNLGLKYSFEIRDKSYFLNIDKILKSQLMASEIDEKNIDISTQCTCCNKERYFSYRVKQKTGRFAGVILIK